MVCIKFFLTHTVRSLRIHVYTCTVYVYVCTGNRLSPDAIFLDLALSSKQQEKAEEFGISLKLDICGLYRVNVLLSIVYILKSIRVHLSPGNCAACA